MVAFSLGLALLASLLLALLPGGTGFVSVMLIPVVVSAVPLAVKGGRYGRVARIVAAVLLLAFAAVSILSIGVYYVPSMVAMTIAAVRK